MKPIRSLFLLAPIFSLALTQCVVVENPDGASTGVGGVNQRPTYGQPLTAIPSRGAVTIMEGSRRHSVCVTASPNVEQTRSIKEQQEIVVKSRGNHGPATVQLFDTSTGREKNRVMAYDIRGGKPHWAAGMGE